MNAGIIGAIAYGILAIVGGAIGYRQAQSKVSLLSGSISGILLIIGGLLAVQGTAWGLVLSSLVTAVLIIVFAVRLAKTRKLMPAGLMIAAGVVALIVQLQGLQR